MVLSTDRASKSTDQLKSALGEKDLAMGEGAATFDQLFPDRSPDNNEDRAWQELQHTHGGLKASISDILSVMFNHAS